MTIYIYKVIAIFAFVNAWMSPASNTDRLMWMLTAILIELFDVAGRIEGQNDIDR